MMNPSGGATAAKIRKRFFRLVSCAVRSGYAAGFGRNDSFASLAVL
jgi:hypothetical protein